MRRIAIVLALATALAACAFDPKLTEQSTLYVDAWVKRNNPAVYVQPMNAPSRPFKALIVPFKVQQDILSARDLGKQLTEVFWQIWSRDGVFPACYYEQGVDNVTPEQAVLMARDRGADCAVVGRIGYLLAGGTQSDSAISLSVEIFDVNTGQRIWSMAHAGRMEPGKADDFILFTRKTRMPMDPLWAIMTGLAADLGGPVKNWNYGMQYKQAGATPAPVSIPQEQAPPPPPKKPLQSSYLES
ncbi:lipoprotein [Fundidesulfovibrio butyratiphilus]